MKKIAALFLTAALLAALLCALVPYTASASVINVTTKVDAVDAKFDDSGVFVYTNTGTSPKKLNSITYHFGNAKLLVFASDGRLIEAGENLIEKQYCVQENVVCPAGGFVVAFNGNKSTQLETLRKIVLEDAMIYNSTMSVTWEATGEFDKDNMLLKITYDNKAKEPAKDALRFLFVGNSTTYVNGCPIKFRALCEAAGKSVIVDYCTKGSAYLANFADETQDCGQRFRNLLKANKYDYVVLQDAAGTTYGKAEQACEVLIPMILANGAKPVFYMRYSDAECNHTRVNNHYYVYSKLAEKYNTVYAPIVVSFYRCFQTYPGIVLMADDGGHHSKEGSYLIAATWMYAFLGIDPLGNSYTADIDPETVRCLQLMAKSSIEEPFTPLEEPGDILPIEGKDGKTYDPISVGKIYTRTGDYYIRTDEYTDEYTDIAEDRKTLLGRMTDGKTATVPTEGDALSRIGCFKGETTTVTIDLGGVSEVKAFFTDLWGGGWGIPDPTGAKVSVAFSPDNKTFSKEYSLTGTQTYTSGGWKGMEFRLELDKTEQARYVRFTYTLDGGKFCWTSESAVWGVAGEEPGLLEGDVDGDGEVNIADYLLTKNYVLTGVAIREEYVARMDVNADNIVDIIDYLRIKRIVLEQK